MRKMLVVLLVAGALVGGGVTYALVSDSSPATAQEDDAATDPDVATDSAATDQASADGHAARDESARATHSGRSDILGELLDDAVADGVITQEQADALRAAWDAKREELRASIGEGRGGRGDHGDRFGGPLSSDLEMFLEDGVIDADELAMLPDGNPLSDPNGPAAEFLEDGQITEEELQELLPLLRGGADYDHDSAPDEDSTTG